jgi:chemotaxis protein methyltransferase CheR
LKETTYHVKEFEVRLGSMIVVRGRCILSICGIGTCIGLAIRDTRSQVSGLAHVVLPESREGEGAYRTPGKYGDTAVRILVKRILSTRVGFMHLAAKLVGGASVLSAGGFDGSRNVEKVRKELGKMNVPIVAEDVGLTYGRSMKFDTETGKITIRRFQQRNGRAELRDTLVI